MTSLSLVLPKVNITFTMERYKSAFVKLVKVLTCQRCKNLFSDPVILDCGHNFCMTCAGDIMSRDNDEGGCCHFPLCRAELKPGRYIYNQQLGKAALIVTTVKEVMVEGCSTAPRVISDRDSGVGSEDAQWEGSSVTGHSPGSMEGPSDMVPDSALLYNFTMALYRSVFEKLVKLFTCRRCKSLFTEPVVLDCGHSFCLTCAGDILSKGNDEGGCCHCPLCRAELKPGRYIFNSQLGNAAVIANEMKEAISEGYSCVPSATSDLDSGVGNDDARSEASSVTGQSLASIHPPPNMAQKGELVPSAVNSVTSCYYMERPPSFSYRQTDPLIWVSGITLLFGLTLFCGITLICSVTLLCGIITVVIFSRR